MKEMKMESVPEFHRLHGRFAFDLCNKANLSLISEMNNF